MSRNDKKGEENYTYKGPHSLTKWSEREIPMGLIRRLGPNGNND